MPQTKVKVVLDADVIIHFAKGGWLHILPSILPEFQFIVLDVVKREIPPILLHLLAKEKSIKEEKFGISPKEIKEFARLTSATGLSLGSGESACMVYCLFHNDVVGSSNTKDVTDYCTEHGITFLTTNDFLFYGIQRGLFTKEAATDFITRVRNLGSYPPVVDFDKYICSKI